MIIDGTGLVLGRMASVAAKKALLGEEVIIVNCENVLITGSKDEIISRYKKRQDRGDPIKGPFFPRMADRIVRRTIRSMMPHKRPRGKEAYHRVMCYLGVPKIYEKQKVETIKHASAKDLKRSRYIKISDLVKKSK